MCVRNELNCNYIVNIEIYEEEEIQLKSGNRVRAVCEIEVIEKNFGTFEEDLKYHYNIDYYSIVLNNNSVTESILSSEDRMELRSVLIDLSSSELESFM